MVGSAGRPLSRSAPAEVEAPLLRRRAAKGLMARGQPGPEAHLQALPGLTWGLTASWSTPAWCPSVFRRQRSARSDHRQPDRAASRSTRPRSLYRRRGAPGKWRAPPLGYRSVEAGPSAVTTLQGVPALQVMTHARVEPLPRLALDNAAKPHSERGRRHRRHGGQSPRFRHADQTRARDTRATAQSRRIP
ncbi:hypothetical protein OV450_8475 [Actinobacteria bacterium OV450]|nr:hypothetical protein OV450_8475 [Actinobacteria bacterium OV450]